MRLRWPLSPRALSPSNDEKQTPSLFLFENTHPLLEQSNFLLEDGLLFSAQLPSRENDVFWTQTLQFSYHFHQFLPNSQHIAHRPARLLELTNPYTHTHTHTRMHARTHTHRVLLTSKESRVFPTSKFFPSKILNPWISSLRALVFTPNWASRGWLHRGQAHRLWKQAMGFEYEFRYLLASQLLANY